MLGMVWSVLKPLMLFAVMYVVFVRFLRFGARHSTLCGVVTIGTDTVVILPRVNITGYGGLLSTGVTYYVKSTFRAYIVVISSTVSAFINLLISLVVVLIFMIIQRCRVSPDNSAISTNCS